MFTCNNIICNEQVFNDVIALTFNE